MKNQRFDLSIKKINDLPGSAHAPRGERLIATDDPEWLFADVRRLTSRRLALQAPRENRGEGNRLDADAERLTDVGHPLAPVAKIVERHALEATLGEWAPNRHASIGRRFAILRVGESLREPAQHFGNSIGRRIRGPHRALDHVIKRTETREPPSVQSVIILSSQHAHLATIRNSQPQSTARRFVVTTDRVRFCGTLG
jgi:hypothetical protein